ncbi:MAG: hypothetical protein LBU12_07060 [Deltaproteobacteria bacterium]|jgi:hypothetical protein|nr:hypothetical protein [Deltaproteobacteria bacterium]
MSRGLGKAAVIVAFAAAAGLLTKLLWNALMPDLFGLGTVNFLQALGLLVLTRLLFGGLGPHGWGHHGLRRRWRSLSPEERNSFLAAHGHDGSFGADRWRRRGRGHGLGHGRGCDADCDEPGQASGEGNDDDGGGGDGPVSRP